MFILNRVFRNFVVYYFCFRELVENISIFIVYLRDFIYLFLKNIGKWIGVKYVVYLYLIYVGFCFMVLMIEEEDLLLKLVFLFVFKFYF